MHNRLIKLFSVVLVSVMLIGMLAACGTTAPAAPSASQASESATAAAESTAAASESASAEASPTTLDFVTLQILYPGDESARMAEFLKNEFATKMKDELNMAIEVSWLPWDQYWNKRDMMVAAGEQIDWFWDGMPNISKVLQAKLAMPLDDLLANYGQDLLKVIPTDNYKATTHNGQIMAIPSQYAPTAEKFKSIIVRQDIMKEVGVTELKSIADIENFAALALAKHPEMKVLSNSPGLNMSRELYPYNVTFDVSNFIALNEDTKKAEITVLSEGYKNIAMFASKWFEKGYIPEDVSLKPAEDVNRMKSGNYLVGGGAISRPMEDIGDLQKNVPTAATVEFLLAPEKPKYKTIATTEILCIGATAKYPERAMMMLNWMLKSKENYMFSIYGVEGKDFKIEGGTNLVLLTKDSFWYEWMFRNMNYMMFPNTVTPEFIESFSNWDKDAKLSCRFGFIFDSTPVTDEMANCSQVLTDKFAALDSGMNSYEQNFEEAKAALLKAGAEKILAEYQKQLDAFIASR